MGAEVQNALPGLRPAMLVARSTLRVKLAAEPLAIRWLRDLALAS